MRLVRFGSIRLHGDEFSDAGATLKHLDFGVILSAGDNYAFARVTNIDSRDKYRSSLSPMLHFLGLFGILGLRIPELGLNGDL
jgi:hypothetical protein